MADHDTHDHTGVPGVGSSSLTRHYWRVYNSTTQAVNSATAALTFDSESDDTDTYHTTGGSNSRATIGSAPLAGLYHLNGSSFASAGNVSWLGFQVNGAAVIGSSYMRQDQASGYISCHTEIPLANGDYVELVVTTSGSCNLGHASLADARSVFIGHRVSD